MQQVVDVSGLHMTLNGQPWMSRGVVLQAFVRPLAALQAGGPQAQLNARENYGATELAAIRNYNADTIRFQVSQPALDPGNVKQYDPNYLNDLVTGVKLARSNGFIVMLMMQDETLTGESHEHPLAIAETQTDWDLLTPIFGSDRGVIFELYNEPELTNTTANWQLWLNGGLVTGEMDSSIGMQSLLNHVRATGSQNLVVIDGLNFAQTLNGIPPITDPLSRMVFAIHPYQDGSDDETHWDANFGIPSTQMPVWADEWSAATDFDLDLGTLPDYQVAVDLLNYLRMHNIPLCTGAFDIPQLVVQSVPPWNYTNYDNFSPTSKTNGSGTLVYNDFAANYGRALTKQDGL